MRSFFIFLFMNISISAFAYEIKFIPLRISTYERVTVENMDNFCPMIGSYPLPSIKMLNPVICSKKLDEKPNVRGYVFEAPDTVVLIDQNKTIILNNSQCTLSTKDRDKLISELEKVMKSHKRDCKNKTN